MLRLLLLTLLILMNAQAKVIIVSDIDDTLRVVNAPKKTQAVANLVKGIKPFEAIRELLWATKSMYESQGEEVIFHYVSASHPAMYNASNWLENNNFPEGDATQKTLRANQNALNYKISTIKGILENGYESDTILMFGDSGQSDVRAYKSVQEQLELANAHIYIRDIGNSNIERAGGVKYFLLEDELLESAPFANISSPQKYLISSKSEVANFVIKNLNTRECTGADQLCREALLEKLQNLRHRVSCQELLLYLVY